MRLKAPNFFHHQVEPDQSCLLFLMDFILGISPQISMAWKNHTPFFYYQNKWLCFLSYDTNTRIIYISFVNGIKLNHPMAVSEGRKKMKIVYVNSNEDVDVTTLTLLFKQALK